MDFVHCSNCSKATGHKRALGWGTFFAVFLTGGAWLVALPFYPKRCIICGEPTHSHGTSQGQVVFDLRVSSGGLVKCLGISIVVLPLLILYIDSSAKGFILSVQSDWGLKVANAITLMGLGLADAAIAAILLVIGLKAGKPREAAAGRFGLFAVVVASLFGQVLKNLFCRSRPLTEKSGQFFVEFPCLGKGAGFISFPSGHSVTAFALAFVLARAYPRYAVLFYGLAVLVALSRVYLVKHFPSDVVAGAAIGILSGWIVCRFAAFFPAHAHT